MNSSVALLTLHCYCQPVLKPKKVPSISLITIALWTFVEAKFSKIEIKHDALFEGRWYTGKKICQIGPNRLCILTSIFIRASCFISILVIWASTRVHKVIFTSKSLGTFFWFQHILATVVSKQTPHKIRTSCTGENHLGMNIYKFE